MVCWTEPGGRRKKKVKKTRPEAQEYKAEVERRISEVKPVNRRSDVPILTEFIETVLAGWVGEVSPRTLKLYASQLECHVIPSIGHLPLVDLRPRRLGEWQKERLAEGAGRATLGKAQGLLGKILAEAVLPWEYLDHNPVRDLKKPRYESKQHRWLTPAQVEAIRNWYLGREDARVRGARIRDVGSATLISVLAYVGMRPQSALALTWADLVDERPGWAVHTEPGGGRICVDKKNVDGVIENGSKTSATAKYWVYIPAPVMGDLEAWRAASGGRPGDLIFPTAHGKPWTKRNWDDWSNYDQKTRKNRPKCFKKAIEDSLPDIDPLPPYGLRHTAATLFVAAGWNHMETAKQLMHGPEVSMRTYQHLYDERPSDGERHSVEHHIRAARGQHPPDLRLVA